MRNNYITVLTIALLFITVGLFAQQSVSIGTTDTDKDAVLLLVGNGDQGLIIPKVTTNGNFGKSGMLVFNTTDNQVYYHNGTVWTAVGGSTSTGGAQTLTLSGNTISISGGNTIQLATSPVANAVYMWDGAKWSAITLTGDVSNNSGAITVGGLKGKSVPSLPATTQALIYNATNAAWEFQALSPGLSTALTSGNIYVGNNSNVATAMTISGDATISNTGALTIANNAVNSAKIQDGSIAANDLSGMGAGAGQVLQYNGTAWVPASGTGLSATLTSGQIYVGSAVNIGTAVSVTGDATLTNAGVLSLALSGATAGTYGSATQVPQLIVDAKGRITSISTQAIPTASVTTAGLLSSTDFTIFSNKVSSVSGTAPITIGGTATAPVISLANTAVTVGSYGSTTTIPQLTIDAQGRITAASSQTIPNAGATTSGLLTTADWNTFNNKGNVNTVAGTAPITIGGTATAPVISLANTAVTVGSYGSTTTIPQLTIDAQGRITAASSQTIPNAGATTSGLLTTADWNTFNNKLGTTSTAGGDLSGTFANLQLVAGTVTGGDLATNISISTTGNLATTGTGTLNVAGASTLSGTLNVTGATTLSTLTGIGTRMVIANASGVISTQALPLSVTTNDLTTTTTGLTITNGTGAINGVAPASINIQNATATQPGLLTAADFTTFNNKGTVTNVTASGPISVATGTTTPAITIAQATTSTDGYLSSVDWNLFKGKLTNPMTTPGDLIYGGTAGAATRLAGGATGILKSNGTTPTWGSVNLASTDVSGTLPVANGGTGVTTAANGQLLIGNGTGFTAATLTGGTNITIANAAGTITINSTALANPLTTTGDIIYGVGTTPTRLAGAAGFLKSTGAAAPAWSALAATDIPNLDASKITTGTFTTAQIPNLDASKITTGTLAVAQIPNLDASKTTTGTFTTAQIPNLDASKITTGILPVTNGGTGVSTATNGQLLIGNGTGFTAATLTAGTNVTITNAAGSITVNSTGLANPMTTPGDIIYGGVGGAGTRLATGTGFLRGGAVPSYSLVKLADLDPAAGILYNGSIPNSVGDLVGDFASGLTIQNQGTTGTNIITAINNGSASGTISGLRVDPSTFGAQNIITTGTTNTGGLSATSTVTFGALAGGGNRFLTIDNAGLISAASSALPTGVLGQTLYHNGTAFTATSNLYNDGTNVGVGSATPQAPLVVKAAGSNLGILKLSNGNGSTGDKTFIGFNVVDGEDIFDIARIASERTGGGGNGRLMFSTAGDNAFGNVERMRIDEFGNVGIGTTAPAAKLDIAGNIKIADGTQAAGKVLTSDANGLATWATASFTAPLLVPATTDAFQYDSNNSIRLTINNTLGRYELGELNTTNPVFFSEWGTGNAFVKGNLGIGTATPTALLDIYGGVIHVSTSLGGSGNQSLAQMNDPVNGLLGAGGLAGHFGGDHYLRGAWGLSFDRYNLGTANPSDGSYFGGNPDAGSASFRYWTGSSWRTDMVIRGSGNVGIGTNNPTATLDIAGNIKIADGTQGAGKVLTSDATGLATWQSVAGTGDMLKSTYDANTNNIIDIAAGGTGLATTPTNGQLFIGNGTGFTAATLTAGTNVTITNAAGSITVNSTGMTNPMTTPGDIIFGAASGTPSRLAGATGILKSNGTTPSWGAINLASADVSGTLPVANGGTGVTTATNGQLLIGNGTGFTAATLTAGTNVTITNAAGNITVNSTALANPLTTTGDIIYGVGTTPTRLAGAAGFLKSTGAAAPTWAALAAIDIPNLDASKITTGAFPVALIPNLDASKITTGSIPILNGGTGATTVAGAQAALSILPNTLNSGNIFVGSGGNVATGVAMTGDAGISNTGVLTIGTGVITSAKILDGTISFGDFAASAVVGGTAGTIQDNSITDADINGAAAIAVTKLGQGTPGQVLTTVGTIPTWVTPTTGWSLTGNDISATPTNFIGTTSNNPLNFKVNNQTAGVIATNNLLFGYNTGTPTTGLLNTGIGAGALNTNTTGSQNTAVGSSALALNTASFNSALGDGALLLNSTGANNTAVGENALGANTTGSNNTAIGNNAGVSSGVLTNATAIGNAATVTASNTIQLGNAAVTTVNVGTGTTATLVAGGLQITGGTPSAGKILTSDATGIATWQTASSSGWGLTGNLSTNAATNYVGTNDLQDLPFRTDGVERMRLTTGGFLGIGTSTPGSTLELASAAPSLTLNSSGNSSELSFFNSGAGLVGRIQDAGSDDYLEIVGSNGLFFNTAFNRRMVIDATGKVGIGNLSPAATLDVVSTGTAIAGTTSSNTGGNYAVSGISTGTGDVAGFFHSQNTGASTHGVYGQADGAGAGVFGGNNGTTGNAGHFWNFNGGNSNPVVVINNSGTGTSLEIGSYSEAHDNYLAIKTAGGNSYRAGIKFRNFSDTDGFSIISDEIVNQLKFNRLDPTENTAMVINRLDGNVGIGTTTPLAKLDINSTGATNGNDAFGLKASTLGGGAGGSTTYGLYSNAHANGGATSMGIYAFGQGGTTNWAGYFDGNTAIAGGLAVGSSPSYGTVGQVLTSAGPGVAPTWSNAGAGSGWSLLGNGSTTDGTHFIGTTDPVPLNFRVNNGKAGRIESSTPFSTFYGYLAGANSTAQNNTAIGYQALSALTSSSNTAVGFQAMQNTSGGQNTALGDRALTVNTTGTGNTALGMGALTNQNTANYNTGVGLFALQFSSGSSNTAVGTNAAVFNSSGSNNTFLGYQAGFPNASLPNANQSGSNNTFIGSNTGLGSSTQRTNATAIGANAFVDADNAMVLGGTGVNAVKVGIGTTTPTTTLQVSGTDAMIMPSGTTAQKPAATVGAGAIRFNTDLGMLEYSDGTNWHSLVPPGTIVAYGGTTAPQGWLMCDGASYSRTGYAKLFTAISTAYGAQDGVTFRVPDFRGKFLRGVDGGAGYDPTSGSRVAQYTGGNGGDSVGSWQAGLSGGAGGQEGRPVNINVNYIIKY